MWALTSTNQFLIRHGVTTATPEGWNWVEEAPPSGVEPVGVVVGDDGVVWMVDVNWTIRFRPCITTTNPQVKR